MRIDDLIARLQEIKQSHGNLEVEAAGADFAGGYFTDEPQLEITCGILIISAD